MYTSKKFNIKLMGISRDNRTNVWSFQCKKCSQWFTPPTTILSKQIVTCTNIKCNESEGINYNDL